MSSVFFTGFPGFLGSKLLACVLDRSPDQRAICLVQAKLLTLAERRITELVHDHPEYRDRVELMVGDITQTDLGLSDVARAQRETTEFYHLAAVYDLAVRRDVGLLVNHTGTKNALRFAEGCPNLRRLQYVSTCYVSGRHSGTFTEDDLELGQSFNNYYEESKYLAEIEVQRRMREGMPVTIYRPSIVVGDSATGATQKYDGPYYVIRWMLRQPWIAPMPTFANGATTQVNLVPRDFVVATISRLANLDASIGRVYHLADPHPLTVRELTSVLARATQRRVIPIPMPRSALKLAIDHVPGVASWMQIPSPAIDYFDHPTRYDCRNTLEELADSGLSVPRFLSYAERLVDFVRSHPEIRSEAMV